MSYKGAEFEVTMRSPLYALLAFSALIAASSMAAVPMKLPTKPNRLFCKTGAENRAATQPLELYFQYNLPVVFEAEDPTVPFGRQTMVLQGRPLMQLNFRKSAEAAGDGGEKLEPMTCAFAHRKVSASEPSHVQIFMPMGQTHWLTEAVGQRPGPKQLSFERAIMTPAGDWSFASQFERIFYVDLEDMKTFVTTQLPHPL
jgi:hypothetical protein